MSSNIYKNKKPVIFFLAPAFIFLAVFLYYPFLQNILNSFKEINNLGASANPLFEELYLALHQTPQVFRLFILCIYQLVLLKIMYGKIVYNLTFFIAI